MFLSNFIHDTRCKAVGLGAAAAFTAVFAAEGFHCWPSMPAEVNFLKGCEHFVVHPHIPVTGISAVTGLQISL
jgi:hypothetical protein